MRFKRNNKHLKTNKSAGFTLVELLVSFFILVIVITGILLCYLKCMELTMIARFSSICVREANSRMEQIRSTVYANIKGTYNLVSYDIPGLDSAKGVIYVDDTTDPNLLIVTISSSWQMPNGRVFGEDANLNGVLDGGEDLNVNGILDSPVAIVNRIYNR